MISTLKKIFSATKQSSHKTSIEDNVLGDTKALEIHLPDDQIELVVGKKNPMPLPDNCEGESLQFMGNSLIVNLLWNNIKSGEEDFLKGICEAISINIIRNEKLISLLFVFSGKPVVIIITADEISVQHFLTVKADVWPAFFVLTEASTKQVKHIRNITLPNSFNDALRSVLKDYKQPNPYALHQLAASGALEKEMTFDNSKYTWLYDRTSDNFVPK